MKKLHFAWIEQVFTFDTAEERVAYVEKQAALAKRNDQETVQVLKEWMLGDRFALRIRKPYNRTPMGNFGF